MTKIPGNMAEISEVIISRFVKKYSNTAIDEAGETRHPPENEAHTKCLFFVHVPRGHPEIVEIRVQLKNRIQNIDLKTRLRLRKILDVDLVNAETN